MLAEKQEHKDTKHNNSTILFFTILTSKEKNIVFIQKSKVTYNKKAI